MSGEQGFQQDPAASNGGFLANRLSGQALGRVTGALLAVPGVMAIMPSTAHADGPAVDARVFVGDQLDGNGEIPVTIFNSGQNCDSYQLDVSTATAGPGQSGAQSAELTGTVDAGAQADLELPAADDGASATIDFYDCSDTGQTSALVPQTSFGVTFGNSFTVQGGEDTNPVSPGGGTSTGSGSSSSSGGGEIIIITTTTEEGSSDSTSSSSSGSGSGGKKPEHCKVPGVTKGEGLKQAARQLVAGHCKLGHEEVGSAKGEKAVVTGFEVASFDPHDRRIVVRRVPRGKVLPRNTRLFPIVRFGQV